MAKFNSATPIIKGSINVFKSRTTGKLYGCLKSNNAFVGMLAEDFDSSLPAFVINVSDEESGESWDFIGNHTQRDPEFTI
jgi:hypothetical protein